MGWLHNWYLCNDEELNWLIIGILLYICVHTFVYYCYITASYDILAVYENYNLTGIPI